MNTIPLIYLAAPYSHLDPYIEQRRFLEINRVAGYLFGRNYHIFSPISHCHPIRQVTSLLGSFAQWESYNRRMIELCDQLLIITLDGWENSVGVRTEILLARSLDKPVKYIRPNTLQIIDAPVGSSCEL